MEIIKEKYTAELRTKLSVEYKKINPSDYNFISEFLIGDKKYRCYESTQVIDSNWDNFIEAVRGSCVQQLSGWVDVKELEGWNFKRIIYVNENEIIGGYQILIKKLPYPLKIGYINYGPVLSTNNSKIIEQIVTDFEKLCQGNKINAAVINPPAGPKELVDELSKRYLKNNIYNVTEAEAELDISGDEIVFYKNFLRMRKQNIHKGNKYEFKVVEGTENDLENFFNLMNETCKR